MLSGEDFALKIPALTASWLLEMKVSSEAMIALLTEWFGTRFASTILFIQMDSVLCLEELVAGGLVPRRVDRDALQGSGGGEETGGGG